MGMTENFEIAGRSIGAGTPPYVIAELSGNHNGEISRAFRLIEIDTCSTRRDWA